MKYNLQRLIKKYAVKDAVTIELTELKGRYEKGEWIAPKKSAVEIQLVCAIVPMAERKVNESAGRYTENDRQLYTQMKLHDKQQIKYKGITYLVDSQNDFTEYGDFFVYSIKAVNTFATNSTN